MCTLIYSTTTQIKIKKEGKEEEKKKHNAKHSVWTQIHSVARRARWINLIAQHADEPGLYNHFLEREKHEKKNTEQQHNKDFVFLWLDVAWYVHEITALSYTISSLCLCPSLSLACSMFSANAFHPYLAVVLSVSSPYVFVCVCYVVA